MIDRTIVLKGGIVGIVGEKTWTSDHVAESLTLTFKFWAKFLWYFEVLRWFIAHHWVHRTLRWTPSNVTILKKIFRFVWIPFGRLHDLFDTVDGTNFRWNRKVMSHLTPDLIRLIMIFGSPMISWNSMYLRKTDLNRIDVQFHFNLKNEILYLILNVFCSASMCCLDFACASVLDFDIEVGEDTPEHDIWLDEVLGWGQCWKTWYELLIVRDCQECNDIFWPFHERWFDSIEWGSRRESRIESMIMREGITSVWVWPMIFDIFCFENSHSCQLWAKCSLKLSHAPQRFETISPRIASSCWTDYHSSTSAVASDSCLLVACQRCWRHVVSWHTSNIWSRRPLLI